MSADIRDQIVITSTDAPASEPAQQNPETTPEQAATGAPAQAPDQDVGSLEAPAKEQNGKDPDSTEVQGEKKENLTKEERREQGRKVELKIDRLHKANAKERTAREAAEAELAALRSEYERLQERVKNVDLDSLDFDERVAELTDRKIQEDRIRSRHGEIQHAAAAAAHNDWASRVDSVADRYPDYDAVVSQANIPLKPEVMQAIKESEFGPDIAYALAKNPEVAQALYGSSPITASKILLQIEQSIGSQYGVAQAAPALAPQAAQVQPTPMATPMPAHASKPPVQKLHQLDMEDFIKHRRANGTLR